MRFGALGDIHGDFETVRRIMRRHPELPFWVSVGDLADDDGAYHPVDAPLYWIKGNNENFDVMASGDLPPNLVHVPNGRRLDVHGVSIAGLGGTFAPTWYDTPADQLPYPGMRTAGVPTTVAPRAVKDDKRRHFVRGEVDACAAMRAIALFMTHEAPRPYFVGGRSGRRGMDAGKTPINEVLASMKPTLHLFGHHHRFTDGHRQGVRSVGLDLVSRSYLIVDAGTMAFDVLDTGSGAVSRDAGMNLEA